MAKNSINDRVRASLKRMMKKKKAFSREHPCYWLVDITPRRIFFNIILLPEHFFLIYLILERTNRRALAVEHFPRRHVDNLNDRQFCDNQHK